MRLYESEFEETITEADAAEMWCRVMNLYLLLYRNQDYKEQKNGSLMSEVMDHPA